MSEAPRSNRPAPRTAAALEAELRRRIQDDLAAATEESDGELSEESLATVIARAVSWALQWHLDAPEHQRGPRLNEGWRSASGPRGRGPERADMEDRRFDAEAPRGGDRDRFGGGPNRGPRPSGGFGDRRYGAGPRRDLEDDDGGDFRAGPRSGGFRSRPTGGPNRGPRPGGGSSRGGGFAGRKPPRRRS